MIDYTELAEGYASMGHKKVVSAIRELQDELNLATMLASQEMMRSRELYDRATKAEQRARMAEKAYGDLMEKYHAMRLKKAKTK